ncbi:hypothetical protein MUG91_G280n12 [Manis pentadactyla]|nr:hypothetical protein MUG91_G280n12 [Manis pentadactyla]
MVAALTCVAKTSPPSRNEGSRGPRGPGGAKDPGESDPNPPGSGGGVAEGLPSSSRGVWAPPTYPPPAPRKQPAEGKPPRCVGPSISLHRPVSFSRRCLWTI